MTALLVVFAAVAFGISVATLVVSNRQSDKPGVAAAARLSALRYAVLGAGLFAGVYWFGFVIIGVVLWAVLLPIGYVLARRG